MSEPTAPTEGSTEKANAATIPASGPQPVAAEHALPDFAPTRFRKLVPFDKLLKKQQDVFTAAQKAEYQREVKHQETWGHLPPQHAEVLRGVDPANVSENAVEKHALTRRTDPVHFAAAKAFHKWPTHAELYLKDYDAAVHAAVTHPTLY